MFASIRTEGRARLALALSPRFNKNMPPKPLTKLLFVRSLCVHSTDVKLSRAQEQGALSPARPLCPASSSARADVNSAGSIYLSFVNKDGFATVRCRRMGRTFSPARPRSPQGPSTTIASAALGASVHHLLRRTQRTRTFFARQGSKNGDDLLSRSARAST